MRDYRHAPSNGLNGEAAGREWEGLVGLLRVMPGLVPGIHAAVPPMPSKPELERSCKTSNRASRDGVDGRDEPGHDEVRVRLKATITGTPSSTDSEMMTRA